MAGPTTAELEAAIRGARSDPGASLRFYRTFLDATVWVGGQLRPDGGIDVHGTTAGCPAFTTRERCEQFFEAAECQAIAVRQLLAQLPDGTNVGLNPGAGLEMITVSHLLVRALKTGELLALDEETFDGTYFHGVLTRPEGALKRSLRRVLDGRPEIDGAFMTVLYEPGSGYPPFPAVWLAGRVGVSDAAKACAEAIGETGRRIAFYELSPGELSEYAWQQSEPFYLGKSYFDTLPEPLSRAQLTEHIAGLPDDPTVAYSPFNVYLTSEHEEAEAKLTWEANDGGIKDRYSLPEYLSVFQREKARELARLKAISTHPEARRVLLDVLPDARPFGLYLRDFAAEARQWEEPIGTSGLVRARYLTLPQRDIETTIEQCVDRLGAPVVGVWNPSRATRFSSPIPELLLSDGDWVQVVGGLIAAASFILVAPESMTGGLKVELRLIQRLGREDNTLIVIDDEESARERRETWEPLLKLEGQPIAEPVEHATFRNKLAGIGIVVTEPQFGEAVAQMERVAPADGPD